MLISENWLREWVASKLNSRALAERLTMAGLEVGSVTPLGAGLEKVIVGEVLSVAPHPQADRLAVCEVDAGKGRRLTVVCGAPNVTAGMKAPLALPGARLPGGLAIEEATVRGVNSQGVLCSAQELGLELESSGLMPLDAAAKPGSSLRAYLDLDDRQWEVELTPNRGDCLSIAGLAREVAALTGARVNAPKIKPAAITSKKKIAVRVRAKRACPRYLGRIIEGVDPHAQTPLWMKEKLRRSGVRSIHPIVDVTNFVMLELGQPLHAFDAGTLEGGIEVRLARQGERLALLDGTPLEAKAGALLIADHARPLALAGVIGGVESAVTARTTTVFLESAFFQPQTVAAFARHHGLHTDSSHRFERGVDPQLQRAAIERASTLILEIAGGRCGPVTEAVSVKDLPKRRPITLRAERLHQLLGMAPRSTQVSAILRALGMRPAPVKGGWRVTPPSYRFDLAIEVDVVEEVARVFGYERVSAALPRFAPTGGRVPATRVPASRLRAVLVDRDYHEAVTYSFVDPDLQAMLDAAPPLRLANPIASNLAVMRTNLWPGLIQALVYNQNRQQERVRLFEIGRRFRSMDPATGQDYRVAGAVTGTVFPEQWGVSPRAVDFFDVKGDVEALMAAAGAVASYRRSAHPALHPGQAAEVWLDGQAVGEVGRLHPEIQARLGLDRPVYVFELQLAAIEQRSEPIYREVSRFPAIRRDLSIVLDAAVPAQDVMAEVARVAGNLLVNLHLFDEYRGEGIDSGRKSLALALTMQDTSRTLKEEVVEEMVASVVSALHATFGAQLRQ